MAKSDDDDDGDIGDGGDNDDDDVTYIETICVFVKLCCDLRICTLFNQYDCITQRAYHLSCTNEPQFLKLSQTAQFSVTLKQMSGEY